MDADEALCLRIVVELGLAIDRLPELGSLRALDRRLFSFDAWPAARRRIEPLEAHTRPEGRSEVAGLKGLPRPPANLAREGASISLAEARPLE